MTATMVSETWETWVTAAPLERLLWIVSFAWTIYHVDHLMFSSEALTAWMGLLVLGLTASHTAVRVANARSKSDINKTYIDRAYSTTSSEDHLPETETPTTPTTFPNSKRKTKIKQYPVGQKTFGIFGASRNSFRADADDGILCGTLLLPMVAMAKVDDVAKSEMDPIHLAQIHAALELTLVMGLLFLLLVFANTLLQPMRRSLRKRGFFVLSLAVSTIFTYTVTRLFPLTPCLRQVPNAINTVVVMAFLWALYICTVALKRCFTLGEMCVLSQATAVLVFDSLCMMMSEGVPSFLKLDNHVDPVTVLLHAVTLGMMLIGMAVYPLLWRSRHLAQKPYWRSNPSAQALSSIHRKRIIISFAVYVLTVACVTLVIAPVCKSIMDEDPFMWTLSFVFLSPQRLLLCVYWALAISATVIVWVLVLDFSSPDTTQQSSSPPSIFNGVQGKTLTSSLNKKRKLFHALAVIMFVPGVLMEPAFLQLAFGVALSAFLYLEYLRYFAIWPYGKSIHLFLTEFIDSRDLGPVILSHIYLLLGCAAPVWLNSSNLLASISGILALGFGDTAASIVGKRYGRWHWPGSKKTIEGTMAFVVTMYASVVFIMYGSAFLGISSATQFVVNMTSADWAGFLITASLTGLLEALSSQNDNIIIPLYIFALILLSSQ